MRAFALRQLETFLAARGAKDGEAPRASELNGGDADAAAGSVNQQNFSGASARRLKQGVVRSPVRHPDAGALGETHLRRQRMDLAFEREGVFGIGAAHRLREIHAVAGL